MLKKTITFKDLDGNPVTEDFYFNLTKADIAEMEFSVKGGLSTHLQTIMDNSEPSEVLPAFKDIIGRSIGRRSEDGRRFIRSQEITDDFFQSEAYSELFMEFLTNASAAAAFFEGVIPAALAEEVKAQAEGAKKDEPSWIKENREPTPEELRNATPEQLREAFARKQRVVESTPPL